LPLVAVVTFITPRGEKIKSKSLEIMGGSTPAASTSGRAGTLFKECDKTAARHELLIGAHANSDWSDGKLVIDANHGPIHLLQTAFYAVRLEVQRRKAAV
jgi:hypothetical protein